MIRLLYNYYEDKNPGRKKEVDMCLQKNLDNPHINVIIIESAEKVTYDTFFQKINKLTSTEDINIIANSDIFFDETIVLANNMNSNAMYALSRWDWINEHNVKFFDRPDSQDAWIFKGPVTKVSGNFTLGKKGCDNRIAHEFKIAGYNVTNPSQSIKSYHVHNSGVRNYNHRDIVVGPYLTIHPSRL